MGVQQSRGWVHYELHRPEPHILLFRRPKGSDPQTGLPPAGFIAPPDSFCVWSHPDFNQICLFFNWLLIQEFLLFDPSKLEIRVFIVLVIDFMKVMIA